MLGSLQHINLQALALQGCFFNDMRGKRDAAGEVVQPALDYSEPIRRFCALRGIACPPGLASAGRRSPPLDAHPLSAPPLSAPSTAPPDTDPPPDNPAAAGVAPGRRPHAAAAAAVPGQAVSNAPAAAGAAGAAGLQADGTAPAAGRALRSGSGTPADEGLTRHGIPSAGSETQWQLPETAGHRTAAMEHTRISDLFLRVSITRAGCCSSFDSACSHETTLAQRCVRVSQPLSSPDQMRRSSTTSGMIAPRSVTPPATGLHACAAGLKMYERCQASSRKELLPALFLSHAAVKCASQLPQHLSSSPRTGCYA